MTAGSTPSDRSARLRAAVERVGNVQNFSERQVRDALTIELARDGITDATEPELQLLVDLARLSPRRAGWRLVGRQVKTVLSILRQAHEALSVGEIPAWARNPKQVVEIPHTEPTLTDEPFTLDPEALRVAQETVQRLLDEVMDQAQDGEEGVRPIDAWLHLTDNGVVDVLVGDQTIGRVPADLADQVKSIIQLFSPRTKALAADADLYGNDVTTARIEIWAPVARE